MNHSLKKLIPRPLYWNKRSLEDMKGPIFVYHCFNSFNSFNSFSCLDYIGVDWCRCFKRVRWYFDLWPHLFRKLSWRLTFTWWFSCSVVHYLSFEYILYRSNLNSLLIIMKRWRHHLKWVLAGLAGIFQRDPGAKFVLLCP